MYSALLRYIFDFIYNREDICSDQLEEKTRK